MEKNLFTVASVVVSTGSRMERAHLLALLCGVFSLDQDAIAQQQKVLLTATLTPAQFDPFAGFLINRCIGVGQGCDTVREHLQHLVFDSDPHLSLSLSQIAR